MVRASPLLYTSLTQELSNPTPPCLGPAMAPQPSWIPMVTCPLQLPSWHPHQWPSAISYSMSSPSLAHPPMTPPLSSFMTNFMHSPSLPHQPLVFWTSAIFLQDPRANFTLTYQASSNLGLTVAHDTSLPQPCRFCQFLHHDKRRL